MNDDIVREDQVKYELMVIIRPDLAMDAISARLEEIRKMLAAKKGESAGEIFFEDVWGMRDLAYRLKKHDRGFYAVFDFSADPSMIKELNSSLDLEPEVLRHMIVKLPFTYQPKSFAVVEEEKVPEKKDDKKGARPQPAKITMVKKEEKAEEVTDVKAPVEEVAEKTKEEKPKKKETTLEDVDAKLKSIIENPDINF
jgi:small subunit ribosomal protein S6